MQKIPCNIGINEKDRAAVAASLNKLLADEFLLYTKSLNFHWNVVGPHFPELHAFFKSVYEELFIVCDDVAERVRALGFPAYGSFQEFSTNTRLTDQPGKVIPDHEMLQSLLQDHESIIRTIRIDIANCSKTYNDEGTANFLTDLMEKHEKTAWMIRVSLEK